jgi:ATP-dependent 26S proteasome regulatory subunit
MVCSDKDGLTIRRYSLDEHVKPMTDEELDLHYGDGFSDFNQKVIDTLKSDSKGLLIFHGTPGSGKTHYIRMLIKELAESTKNVIYIPSSFVEMFMEPSFLTFLQDWIVTMNNPTIILIEDSESLIESRDPGYRSQGISNLLNATDGILNDILGTQIILTFNIDIEMIDDALLRPERLLARKEFLDLDSEQAKKLLLHLGIDNYEPQGFMSLASIYSMKNSRNIIEHNARRKKERIGF